MNTALVGLGRMGMNMARRLLRGGHPLAVYNRSPQKTQAIAQEGARAVYEFNDLDKSFHPRGRSGSCYRPARPWMRWWNDC